MVKAINESNSVYKNKYTFKNGDAVTICYDANCKYPQRTGYVKRHGQNAWQLSNSFEWFDFNGMATNPKDSEVIFYARPYQNNDEALIELIEKKIAKWIASNPAELNDLQEL